MYGEYACPAHEADEYIRHLDGRCGIILLKLIGNTLVQRRYRLADGWQFVGQLRWPNVIGPTLAQ